MPNQYELEITETEKEAFIRTVRIRMLENGWSMKELAEKTGYEVQSCYNFFQKGKKGSRFLAAAIAEVLGIKEKEWRDERGKTEKEMEEG